MQNSEFEKSMQQKMDELKFVPSDAVWNKVEAGLPKKEKNRRWVFFILFFAVLLFGSLVWFNKTSKDVKETKDDKKIVKINAGPNTITKNKIQDKTQHINDTVSLKVNQPLTVLAGNNNVNTQKIASGSFKIKIKNPSAENLGYPYSDNITGTNQKKLTTKGKVKARIKAPVQDWVDNEKNGEVKAGDEENGKVKTIDSTGTIAAIIENKTNEEIVIADSLAVNKKDTAEVIVANKDEKKKPVAISKWQYGIYLASGRSDVTNKLFSNKPVFANLNNNVYSSPGSQVSQPRPGVPGNPSGSLALSIGFFAGKHINKKWKFATGINYMYQSNSIKVGSKVDTVVTVNFDASKSLSASNYYRAGNTGSYKNKFHLIEIPLLFQYDFSGKSALYVEAGPTISCLLNSNALVYNVNSSSYITDAAIFNRLLVGANAGFGINVLQRSGLPFSVGYQFKYAAVSAVKKPFGKQHFVNSMLYLKIPFNK